MTHEHVSLDREILKAELQKDPPFAQSTTLILLQKKEKQPGKPLEWESVYYFNEQLEQDYPMFVAYLREQKERILTYGRSTLAAFDRVLISLSWSHPYGYYIVYNDTPILPSPEHKYAIKQPTGDNRRRD